MLCILITSLVTVAIGVALAAFAYDRMTDYGTLPDDGNMSGPGY